MIKINLLSEGKRPAAVRKARTVGLQGADIGQWLLVAGVLLGVLVAVGRWYLLKQELEAKVQEVAQAQKEVDELQEVIKQVDEFKHKKAELERKIKVINDLKLNQRGPVRVMDYISRALPELLWLDHMRMNASSIEVEGRAFNTNAVAAFMENLDKVPEFKEPTLKDTQVQALGVYHYVIDFDYTFAPPAAKGAAAAPGTPATPPTPPTPPNTATGGAVVPPPALPGASTSATPPPASPGPPRVSRGGTPAGTGTPMPATAAGR
jgi:type IV pilus assembly protein PilN